MPAVVETIWLPWLHFEIQLIRSYKSRSMIMSRERRRQSKPSLKAGLENLQEFTRHLRWFLDPPLLVNYPSLQLGRLQSMLES